MYLDNFKYNIFKNDLLGSKVLRMFESLSMAVQADSAPIDAGPRLPTDPAVPGPGGPAGPGPTPGGPGAAPAGGEAAEAEKTEAELDLSTLLANIFDAADEENELELRWEKKTTNMGWKWGKTMNGRAFC